VKKWDGKSLLEENLGIQRAEECYTAHKKHERKKSGSKCLFVIRKRLQ
jgi:hypothetical protein